VAASFQSAPGVHKMWVERSHIVVIYYDPQITDAEKLLTTLTLALEASGH